MVHKLSVTTSLAMGIRMSGQQGVWQGRLLASRWPGELAVLTAYFFLYSTLNSLDGAARIPARLCLLTDVPDELPLDIPSETHPEICFPNEGSCQPNHWLWQWTNTEARQVSLTRVFLSFKLNTFTDWMTITSRDSLEKLSLLLSMSDLSFLLRVSLHF